MNRKIPVLVLAFNRADHVAEAMKPIKAYQPVQLYLACDGPRANKDGEREAVDVVRKTMLDMVDWPCEVRTLFRDENLGCANAVYGAITWFFEHEEYGIIVEDDVVLSQDFFLLCEDLLLRYAAEERVMQISARNTSRRKDKNNTYLYTQCFHCWGWATWRRAWMRMDMSMSAVNRVSTFYLIRHLGILRGIMMRKAFCEGYNHLDTFNSWATRWYLSILDHDALVICPGVNLAINIGMANGAHFNRYDAERPGSSLFIDNFEWPIKHNDSLLIDTRQTIYDSNFFFRDRIFGFKKKIRQKLYNLF